MNKATQTSSPRWNCWNHDVDWGESRPPKPELKPTAPALAYRALTGRLPPIMGLIGLVPRGRADLGPFARLIDGVVPPGQEWASHPSTWIMVVDASTGERVPLGRAGAPRLSLSAAVRASYAIPGWCPPVTAGGRTYLDGGIASPTSADLLVGTGVSEAIVLAPMACRALDPPRGRSRVAEQMRRHMTRIVNREVHLLEQAGIRVARLEPGAEDLEAIGSNMMNPRRRRRVFDAAVRTAKDAVADALLGFHDRPVSAEPVET